MKYLIVRSHPYDGSFSAGAVKTIGDALAQTGRTAEILDLVSDGFDPVMRGEDLRLWGKGQTADPHVPAYQEKIKSADVLVFPFPIWWGCMPAVLKGFCDKVLLPGWAYRYGEQGELIGMLTDKKAVVITTMETPKEIYAGLFNNAIEGSFLKDTLGTCGIELLRYFQFDQIVSGGRPAAEEKLKEIETFFLSQ